MIGRHVSRLTGYAPALPSPFDDRGQIDCAAFENFGALQIKAGASALVVCGTTGEAPTLGLSEHNELVRIAADVARGQVPVIAGAGANATSYAVALSRDAEAAGADAILSVVPYYNKPSQAGLYAHFRAIAGSTGLPIITLRRSVTNGLRSGRSDGFPARRKPAVHRLERCHRRRYAAASVEIASRPGVPAAVGR